MNVTVMVPKTLRPAVDGRGKLSLGLPAQADVGDLMVALLTLYPKLRQHVASEKASKPTHLALFAAEPPREGWRERLREGQTLYLSAAEAKRLVT